MAKKSNFISDIFDTVRAIRSGATALNRRFDISGSQKRALEGRTSLLLKKYGDQGLVEALLAGRYWVGQLQGQLRDALGAPSAIDQKNMATRTRQIWKYYPTGVNRYQLRITLDDGIVASWDSKDHE